MCIERVAHPGEVRAKDGACYTMQGRNIKQEIEDSLCALVLVHTKVQNAEEAQAREGKGGAENDSSANDEPPPLEQIPGQY